MAQSRSPLNSTLRGGLFLLLRSEKKITSDEKWNLLIVTVATEETDGLQRLRKSATEFGHTLEVFGLGEKWTGGDMQQGTGGAQKIRLLRENLILKQTEGNSEHTIVMFIDAYDVIINSGPEIILRRYFTEFPDAGILFSAEPFCWPDRTLAPSYPLVTFGERYLNSGIFMGRLFNVLAMLTEYSDTLRDDDDDQLFYTKLYLDKNIRTKLKMELDSLSRIFQNLNGMTDSVTLEFDDDGYAQIYNKHYNTHPAVIHGNGPSKIYLNYLGNYIAHTYNLEDGYLLQKFQPEEDSHTKAVIGLAIFLAKPVPYIEEFLDSVTDFVNMASSWGYASAQLILFASSNKILSEHMARDEALKWSSQKNVDFLIMLDSDVHLTNKETITELAQTAAHHNVGILTPMIVQSGKLFSNFWGAVSHTGYYARSDDYVELAERRRSGLWNVPFVNSILAFSRQKISFLAGEQPFSHNKMIDPDMSFAQYCRDNGHFMIVDNRRDYGFLVESDGFANLPLDSIIHPELYDFPNNKQLWEKRYIHPLYFEIMKPDGEVPLACPDVYDFPFVSERFCREIIEVMENYGQWSDGGNNDRRLEGGYENVPTRDIHMNQIGFDRQWLAVVDEYVAPVQEKVFIGFYQRPAKSNMMFVVRYRPDEQASLRPHHDASTYSIDIALNKQGVDYEGGGVRYVRYNCTVPADQVGYSMLFPGRLTHLHEGLPTTKGTRYILVSFINP
ncbi:procollagen-lysine,2-oxoglutarate 5-dioxygenase 3 [Ditylenchus destructor]|nr:procollagen-lysine,2-oxoglutarate 5-dioxygenase 3 [Ditylenchus destructor]